jgi:glutamate synthase domain-containing protein 1
MNFRTKYSVELPAPFEYATGLFFLDKRAEERAESQRRVEESADVLGLKVICWREVPCNNDTIGQVALSSEPAIFQAFVVANDKSWPEELLQRKVYVLRKWMTHTLAYEVTGYRFYICSLSTRYQTFSKPFHVLLKWHGQP